MATGDTPRPGDLRTTQEIKISNEMRSLGRKSVILAEVEKILAKTYEDPKEHPAYRILADVPTAYIEKIQELWNLLADNEEQGIKAIVLFGIERILAKKHTAPTEIQFYKNIQNSPLDRILEVWSDLDTEHQIDQKNILLQRIETLLAKKYKRPKETKIYRALLSKSITDLQAFFDTLVQDDKEEEQEAQTHREEERKKKVLQDLETALKSLAYNVQNLHPYLIAYQDKEIPEIEAFIEKIQSFQSTLQIIPNYLKDVLTHNDIHHLDEDEIRYIKQQLEWVLDKTTLTSQFLQNPDRTLDQFSQTTEEINAMIEEARARYLRIKIDERLETWDDTVARISPEDETELSRLLTHFVEGTTTESGLIELDRLLNSISPEEGGASVEIRFSPTGRLVTEILKPYQNLLHQQETEPGGDPGATAELKTIEYHPSSEDEARNIKILKAVDEYKKLEQTIEKEKWHSDAEVSAVCDTHENDEETLTQELGKIRFPSNDHYLVILRVENPLAGLRLSEQEKTKLPQELVMTYDKLYQTGSFTYFKRINTSEELPIEVPKGVPADCRGRLRAYVEYNRFEQKTGKIQPLFERLAIEEQASRNHHYGEKPKRIWALEKSGFEIERQNALLFLENDWAEYDGDKQNWIERNVNFRTGETPACVSIATIPLIPGRNVLTKKFIRFHKYPINYEKVPQLDAQIEKIGGTIEHFFIHTQIAGRGNHPTILDATRSFIPVNIFAASDIEPEQIVDKSIDSPTPEHEFHLLGSGYSEVTYDQLHSLLTPGNYFSEANRFSYLNLVVVEHNGTPKYYTKFSRGKDETKKIQGYLDTQGVRYEMHHYPLEKTYQDELRSYSTVPDPHNPLTARELSIYQYFEPTGFNRCPKLIYDLWLQKGQNGKERIASCFPDGTAVTILTVPSETEEPWIFVRTEKNAMNPVIPENLQVPSYTVEQYLISSRDGLVEVAPKETRTAPKPVDLGADPARLAREAEEKRIREIGRQIQKLLEDNIPVIGQKSEKLQRLLHLNAPPQILEDAIQSIKSSANQGDVDAVRANIELANKFLDEQIAEQEQNVIEIPRQKTKKSFWKNPWTYAGAAVLAGFVWAAGKFLPEGTLDENKNTPETTEPAPNREPVVIKINPQPRDAAKTVAPAPQDAGPLPDAIELQEATVAPVTYYDPDSGKSYEVNEAGHRGKEIVEDATNQESTNQAPEDAAKYDVVIPDAWTKNDAGIAAVDAAAIRDAAPDVPNLPFVAASTAPASSMPAEEDIPGVVRTFQNRQRGETTPPPVAETKPKTETPKSDAANTHTESINIKAGNRMINVIVDRILSENPTLKKSSVRGEVARVALEDAANNEIRPGGTIDFDYTVNPDKTVAVNMIHYFKPGEKPAPIAEAARVTPNKQSPTEAKIPETPKSQVEMTQNTPSNTVEDSASPFDTTFHAGDTILYATPKGGYGIYKMSTEGAAPGSVILEGATANGKKVTFAVKKETLEKRGQIVDLDATYGSFGVKKVNETTTKLQFIGFDGGIEEMLRNYFQKHLGLDRSAAIKEAKKVMQSAKNIPDASQKTIYKKAPDLMEVGSSLLLETTTNADGEQQTRITQISKKYPNITELPKASQNTPTIENPY